MAGLKGFYEDFTLTEGVIEREVQVRMDMRRIGDNAKMKVHPDDGCSGE